MNSEKLVASLCPTTSHCYDSAESIADSDLEDEQLCKILASPLYIQEREGDFDSSGKQKNSGKFDAMVKQKRKASAQWTQADDSGRESLMSSSSREPRVSRKPGAMFFGSEPTLNTILHAFISRVTKILGLQSSLRKRYA